MRCGTPRRCSAIGSPSSAPAWSAAAWRGCSPAFRASEVTLVDVDAGRATSPTRSASTSRCPRPPSGGRDLVLHTSASAAGLQLSLDLLAAEGTVIDLSWYGDAEVRLSLGGAFHSGRLTVRASQVGMVSPARRASRSPPTGWHWRWICCGTALSMCCSPGVRFDELPAVLADSLRASLPALCHIITLRRTREG